MQITIFERITTKDKAFLARQLATMLSSGLTLDKALVILRSQVTKATLKKTLNGIIDDLESGLPFSEALKKYPKVFDRVFINIVVSGEAVGKLPDVLVRLADQLEKQDTFLSKITGALYYPIFIFLVMIVIIILMMVYVIPPLKEVFSEFETSLPWTTTVLLSMSDFAVKYWWIVLSVAVLGILLLLYFFRTKQGKYILDEFLINSTLGLGKDVYMARFARTMSMLVQAGTPIIDTINITGDVMNNLVYKRILTRVSKQIERGVPMSVQIEKSKDFPILVPQMIAVGERTGKLEQVLNNLAIYYENESDNKIKAVTSLFEPMVIVILAIGVAFIVFSIIMPIYQIAELG